MVFLIINNQHPLSIALGHNPEQVEEKIVTFVKSVS